MSTTDHRQQAEDLLSSAETAGANESIIAAAQVHALLAIEERLAAIFGTETAINEVVELLGPERASQEFHEAQRLMRLRKAGMR